METPFSPPALESGTETSASLLPALDSQRDLAERMAVAERIVRIVAHDLNNIFQSLLVNLQFAENGARDQPGVASDIRDAQQTTERALSLAKRLQVFTRSHALANTSLDLCPWLVRHREHLAGRAGHAIAVGIRTPEEPCPAKVDGAALLEALERLVDNAVDAMPRGGTLLLSLQPVEVPAEYSAAHPYKPASRMVLLEVKDSGPGMEPDVARHAFELFFSRKRDSRDSGYGLAFVFATVRKMAGLVDIVSSPGRGTAVRLYFPAAETARPEAPETPARSTVAGDPEGRGAGTLPPPRGILVVESDPIVREVAARCLAREGYPVFEAADGEAAIEVFQRRADEIALVVLEFALPRRSGLEVQAAIRAIAPQQRFLFSSSFNSDLRLDAIAEDPRIQLIPKPFTRADLLNTVELMIGRP